MPSKTQFARLGELVRDARHELPSEARCELVGEAPCRPDKVRVNDSRALGAAISLAYALLRPWLRDYLKARLSGDGQSAAATVEVEDISAEISLRAVRGFAHFKGSTGEEFYVWLRKMAACRVADHERHRQARRRDGGETISLDGDAAAASLAALLEDGSPSPEAAARRSELRTAIRGAMKGLTPAQRRVTRRVMEGASMKRIAAALGPSARSDWQAARAHLRRILKAGSRPRKPR